MSVPSFRFGTEISKKCSKVHLFFSQSTNDDEQHISRKFTYKYVTFICSIRCLHVEVELMWRYFAKAIFIKRNWWTERILTRYLLSFQHTCFELLTNLTTEAQEAIDRHQFLVVFLFRLTFSFNTCEDSISLWLWLHLRQHFRSTISTIIKEIHLYNDIMTI